MIGLLDTIQRQEKLQRNKTNSWILKIQPFNLLFGFLPWEMSSKSTKQLLSQFVTCASFKRMNTCTQHEAVYINILNMFQYIWKLIISTSTKSLLFPHNGKKLKLFHETLRLSEKKCSTNRSLITWYYYHVKFCSSQATKIQRWTTGWRTTKIVLCDTWCNVKITAWHSQHCEHKSSIAAELNLAQHEINNWQKFKETLGMKKTHQVTWGWGKMIRG